MKNKCKYLRIRRKKYEKYLYCNNLEIKKEITFNDCKNCKNKNYKQVKSIKKTKIQIKTNKVSKRAKATDILQKVKKTVWERDNHECIICHEKVSMTFANAHLIKRSQRRFRHRRKYSHIVFKMSL